MIIERTLPQQSDPMFYAKVLEENRKLKEEVKELKQELIDELGWEK